MSQENAAGDARCLPLARSSCAAASELPALAVAAKPKDDETYRQAEDDEAPNPNSEKGHVEELGLLGGVIVILGRRHDGGRHHDRRNRQEGSEDTGLGHEFPIGKSRPGRHTASAWDIAASGPPGSR